MAGKENWVQKMLNDQKDKLCKQSRSFQSNQPIPNPSHDRTGQPVVRTDRTVQPLLELTWEPCQEIDTRSFHEEAVDTDRTGQPVVETGKTQTRSSDDSKSLNVEMAHDRTGNPLLKQTQKMWQKVPKHVLAGQPVVNHDESSHEQTMLNEVNMDFRIPELPHSVVKHAESSRVRDLVRKIENHPDRHLRQNKAYNPFSAESKRMIQEVGNVRAVCFVWDGPQYAVQSMPIIIGVKASVYCTCGHLLKETVAQSTFSL